jgi:AAA ATPase domain
MRCPVFVGRSEELAALAEIFSRTADGHGACAVVAGEAGVGKTRLVTDAAGRARERGRAVLVGRSTPTDRVSPLRPLGEALLDGLRDRRPPDDPVLAPYLPALGTLVPHWAAGSAFPAVPPPPVVLAEAMLRVLRWLSGGRGAILVLEDMHWADRETLAVLAYLADHVAAFPVAVVITARSDEPGWSGFGSALTRNTRYLRLAPLADTEVAAMAAACLGVDTAPEAILSGLRRNASGLPLLVEDLVGVAGQPGPLRYAEIISGRLAGLDAASRGVVEAAAVLGTEVDAGLLGRVSGLAPSAAADAMTAARASGLLTVVDGQLAFRHALVRELVLAQLDHRDRARLCRRAAETLEVSAAGLGAVSERLGELWIQGGEPRRAVMALLRAARAARAAGAIAAGEALVRRALAVASPDLAGAARLELLELLAVAGRIDELSTVGTQALDDLAHDPDLTAAVHLLLARAAVGAGVRADAGQHLDAVSALGALSPRRIAQVRVVRAAAVIAGGSAERLALSARLAGQAVRAAEEAGDPELSCEALELLAVSLRPRDLTAAAGVLRRELGAAERGGLVLWRLRALNELGTVEAMRDARGERLRRAYEVAVRVGALDTAASVLINLAGLYVMTDVIPEALAAAGQARELAAPLGRPRPSRQRRRSRLSRMGWRDAAPTWSRGCAGRWSWRPATPTSPPMPPVARVVWWPCCSRNAPRRWPRSLAVASLASRSARPTPGIRRFSSWLSRVMRLYPRWKPSWRGPRWAPAGRRPGSATPTPLPWPPSAIPAPRKPRSAKRNAPPAGTRCSGRSRCGWPPRPRWHTPSGIR